MVDFKKAIDKPLSQKTEPLAPAPVPLPPGCHESMQIGDEPIHEVEIGDSFTGRVVDLKSVQTASMKKANNLVTFQDDAFGRIKFWSSGHLNQFFLSHPDIGDYKITIQRIEDQEYAKGEGKTWRVFLHT